MENDYWYKTNKKHNFQNFSPKLTKKSENKSTLDVFLQNTKNKKKVPQNS